MAAVCFLLSKRLFRIFLRRCSAGGFKMCVYKYEKQQFIYRSGSLSKQSYRVHVNPGRPAVPGRKLLSLWFS